MDECGTWGSSVGVNHFVWLLANHRRRSNAVMACRNEISRESSDNGENLDCPNGPLSIHSAVRPPSFLPFMPDEPFVRPSIHPFILDPSVCLSVIRPFIRP